MGDLIEILRQKAAGQRNKVGDLWADWVCERAADELARLRAEVGELDDMRMQLAGLTAIYENQTAYTIFHGGRGIGCNDAMRQAYSDQKVRAETAERERDELRRRIAEAPKGLFQLCLTDHVFDADSTEQWEMANMLLGKRVALVVLDAEEAK